MRKLRRKSKKATQSFKRRAVLSMMRTSATTHRLVLACGHLYEIADDPLGTPTIQPKSRKCFKCVSKAAPDTTVPTKKAKGRA